MIEKKQIVVIGSFVVLLALIAGLIILNKHNNPTPVSVIGTSTPTMVTATTTTVIPKRETGLVDTLWNTFQKYLNLAKKHDLAGVRSLSYQLSATCLDSTKVTECNALMDSAYNAGKGMKLSSLGNVWSDSKQVILSSGWVDTTNGVMVGAVRSIIYFAKGTDGTYKVLSFDPSQGIFLNSSNMTPTQVESRKKVMLIDSDSDGLFDQEEACADISIISCVPTHPHQRDSNGNGWWDGIEALFYKK